MLTNILKWLVLGVVVQALVWAYPVVYLFTREPFIPYLSGGLSCVLEMMGDKDE